MRPESTKMSSQSAQWLARLAMAAQLAAQNAPESEFERLRIDFAGSGAPIWNDLALIMNT